jgi:hypothetical protein
MPSVFVRDEAERRAQRIRRDGKVETWRLDMANIPDLDPFVNHHMETALTSFLAERWEASVAFSGLAVEEQLAALYATKTPSPLPPCAQSHEELTDPAGVLPALKEVRDKLKKSDEYRKQLEITGAWKSSIMAWFRDYEAPIVIFLTVLGIVVAVASFVLHG